MKHWIMIKWDAEAPYYFFFTCYINDKKNKKLPYTVILSCGLVLFFLCRTDWIKNNSMKTYIRLMKRRNDIFESIFIRLIFDEWWSIMLASIGVTSRCKLFSTDFFLFLSQSFVPLPRWSFQLWDDQHISLMFLFLLIFDLLLWSLYT